MPEQTPLSAHVSGPTRRQRRRTLTDKQVASLPRKAKRYILADPEQRGLYLRVPASGPVVFAAVARHDGKQVWATLGSADVLLIAEAREKAREAIGRIKQGLEPFEPAPVKPDSVADVAAQWLKRHVEARGLRTAAEIKRQLDVYILPLKGDSPFAQLRRGDIARLLDVVEDKHGAWVADAVLGVLRAMATWFASPLSVVSAGSPPKSASASASSMIVSFAKSGRRPSRTVHSERLCSCRCYSGSGGPNSRA